MKKYLLLFALLALPVVAFAQHAVPIANAGTTGTTLNTLTKLTGAPSTAVIAGTSDTAGIIGITAAGAGTSGTAAVVTWGITPCVFDNTTVAGHYVQISSSVAGNCHDAGATRPTSGQIIGMVLASGSAGTYNVLLNSAELVPASGITASSSDTLTNKTLDCEGTGNTCTVPAKVFLAAAGCNNATASPFWDLPTSTPAVAACVTGTNIQKGVLQFADTSGGFSAQNTVLLPADFSGAIDARIIWRTSATSGNAKFSLSTICTDVAASATDDPAFNTASTVTTAAPGSANRIQVSAITGVTATGCSAGNLLHVKLFRDGNDAADTIGASLDVIGVELTIRRAM